MKERETFGRFGAVMAMAGSAVGLGNLWRFPYLLGEYGGAAFLVLYLVCALFIALPIFICEFVIGRRSNSNCLGAFKKLSSGSGAWKYSGILNVVTTTIILCFYCVIGGWCIEYFFKACIFGFDGGVSRDEIANIFSDFVTSVWPPLTGFIIFAVMTCFIVMRGIKNGIERFGKVAMPVLCLVILAIAVYVAFLPGAKEGYIYMFRPDFSKLTANVFLAALGQSFFSLSLGCGCIITYASYVRKEDDIVFHGVGTTLIDIMFAIIAGCAIMPAVFAFGVDPASGPSLVYETLPFIFSLMPAGNAVAIVFFGVLLAATLTSSISMCEVGVAYLTEELGYSRKRSVIMLLSIVLAVGGLCSLSFGPLSSFKIFGYGIFDICDKLSSNVLMIAGALLIVIFVGWKMKRADVMDEFTSGGKYRRNEKLFRPAYFLIRYVAPAAITAIFAAGLLLG